MDDDTISRQAAIEAIDEYDFEFPNYMERFVAELRDAMKADLKNDIEALPSAQPDRLTDDDFETIRIHLNACKEKLCNQQRWKEAEEYQHTIDRFMAFASVQPQITHCAECIHWKHSSARKSYCEVFDWMNTAEDFCSFAERRTDE